MAPDKVPSVPGAPPPGSDPRDAETVEMQAAGVIPTIPGYEIRDKLGHGGMGTVWRAIQEGTQREVAIKVVNATASWSPTGLARFSREVKLSSQFEHPNIARVYDAGTHLGVSFYVMERIQGLPLYEHITEHDLKVPEVLRLVAKIARAMQHAHDRRIIHRDLKPSNILVTKDHEPHILDFGLAKLLDSDDGDMPSLTLSGGISGTLAYMSPEQAAGDKRAINYRSDIYALGVNLFRCLTGELPQESTQSGATIQSLNRIVQGQIRKPHDVIPGFDPAVEKVLLKALALEPERRYPDMLSFAEALETCAGRAQARVDDGAKQRLRRRRLLRTAVVLALVLGGIGLWYQRYDKLARMADLVPVTEAEIPSLVNLAEGGAEAYKQVVAFSKESGLPLEVTGAQSGITFRLIPPGNYQRGSRPVDKGKMEDEPLVDIEILRPFYVSKTEITQAQWKRITGEQRQFKFPGDNHPAELIQYPHAVKFTWTLCDLEEVPRGTYRLLWEDEWEYACRAGTEYIFYFEHDLHNYVNHRDIQHSNNPSDPDDGFAHTAPVGSYLPNAWGLYDMLGNLAEWVGDPFEHAPVDNKIIPSPPNSNGTLRMMRGGAFSSSWPDCRAAERNWVAPGTRLDWIGFRIMREIPLSAWKPAGERKK